MENTGANLKISIRRTVLLSMGGLFQAVWLAFCLLYGIRLTDTVGVVGAIILVCVAGTVSALLIPFVYFFINRTRSNFWGRYHLALAVLVLVSAASCAGLWSVGGSDNYAMKVAATGIVLPLCMTSTVSVGYIVSSVGTRLLGDDPREKKYRTVFDIVGVVLGLLICVLPLFDCFEVDAVGYALSCLITVVGVLMYFAGVGSLPRFVRPLSRKVTIRSVCEDFFRKPAPRVALSSAAYLLLSVAAITALGYINTFVRFNSLPPWSSVTIAAVSTAVGAVTFVLARQKKAGKTVAVVGTILFCAAAVLSFVLFGFVPLGTVWATVTAFAVYTVYGIGFGLTLSAYRRQVAHYGDKYTSGASFCLEAMLMLLATAGGSALAAGLSVLESSHGLVFVCVGCALSLVALGLAVAACAPKKQIKKLKEESEIVES